MTNFSILFNSFYRELNVDFNEIDLKKLLEIKVKSKSLNKYFKNEYDVKNKTQKYCKIMEMIHTSYKGNINNIDGLPNYVVTNTGSEKTLLYMLSVDPELEALIIYKSCNTIKEIKNQMTIKFGIYDPNLVKIEKHYLDRFLSTDKKNQINEEIQKRVYR